MASVCISNSVTDTSLPIRPLTFVNLYKWPESDVEFVKRVNSNNCGGPYVQGGFDDSLSCRQVYLRSYKFSRKKEGVTDKAIKYCFSRLKESVVRATNTSSTNLKVFLDKRRIMTNLKVNYRILRRAKVVSCHLCCLLLNPSQADVVLFKG